MQTTANYGLKKPDGTDVVDIQDFNDNADAIDLALKQAADAAGAIGSHAATHRPGGSDSISTAAPSGGLGTANGVGSSTSLARADHTHLAFDSINPAANGAASAGSAATAARRDHVHPTDATRAPLASPAFTGTPTAPTAAVNTNTPQIATTAFVKAAIAVLLDSSPATLDTLNELAAALGDDPNFATTITNLIATKADQTVVATHLAENATLTTKGHVQLSSSISSIDETIAATAKAVKTAYDKGDHSHPYASSTHSHIATDLPSGTTAGKGIVQLSSSVASTSTSLAATASAVKAAYDKASSAGMLLLGSYVAPGAVVSSTVFSALLDPSSYSSFKLIIKYYQANDGSNNGFRPWLIFNADESGSDYKTRFMRIETSGVTVATDSSGTYKGYLLKSAVELFDRVIMEVNFGITDGRVGWRVESTNINSLYTDIGSGYYTGGTTLGSVKVSLGSTGDVGVWLYGTTA